MTQWSWFVNKDVQRLREPGAWVLLGSVALQILSGLIGLLFGRGRLPFMYQAAIRHDAPEILVYPWPIRPALVLSALAPRLAERLNELGHTTVGGCPWNHGQVKRVLDRA